MDISTYWIVNFQIIFVILFSRFIVPLRKKIGVNRIITLKVNKYISNGYVLDHALDHKFDLKLLFPRLYGGRLRPATLLKKRLYQWCFPVNFPKFVRTPFLQNTSGRLFLYVQEHRERLLVISSRLAMVSLQRVNAEDLVNLGTPDYIYI